MVERVRILLSFSLAKSTKLVYRRAWVLFRHSMNLTSTPFLGKKSLPVTVTQLMFYVGYLNDQKLSAATSTSYVSAIGYVHRVNGWVDPSSNPIIQKMLAAANKLKPQQDSRLPITIVILNNLVQSLQHISGVK